MNKVLMIVGAAAFAAVGWFGNQVLGPRERPREQAEVADPAVSVGVAKTVEFNPETEYVGHVEPIQETDILPQIDGYVKRVCFTEGAFVKAGDVLFEIDTEQYDPAAPGAKGGIIGRQEGASCNRYTTSLSARYVECGIVVVSTGTDSFHRFADVDISASRPSAGDLPTLSAMSAYRLRKVGLSLAYSGAIFAVCSSHT